MTWVNCAGVVLQVVGLFLAMFLLARLRETVTGHEVAPLRWGRLAWRRLRRLGRWMLCRKPTTHVLQLGGTSSGKSTLSAQATVTRGPMPPELGSAEQVAWLEQFIRDVERRHNELSAEIGRQVAALNAADDTTRRHAEQLMRQAVEDVRTEFRTLVGNDVGWEAFSLVLVAVGVIMAAL